MTDKQSAIEAINSAMAKAINPHGGPKSIDDYCDRQFCCFMALSTHSETILAALQSKTVDVENFQDRVGKWMQACFGPKISSDKIERNHRFLEESLELVQANDCTKTEAHQLVDYVYGRDVGEINQEVGGVMITLAALCLAGNINMHEGGEVELVRIWTKVKEIRTKQANKPNYSPLPQPPEDTK